MRDAKVIEQMLVGQGLLERVEVRPVEVLYQGLGQHLVVAGVPNHGSDLVKARQAGCSIAALSSDDLVRTDAGILRAGRAVTRSLCRSYDDRLEQAYGTDRCGKLFQRGLFE